MPIYRIERLQYTISEYLTQCLDSLMRNTFITWYQENVRTLPYSSTIENINQTYWTIHNCISVTFKYKLYTQNITPQTIKGNNLELFQTKSDLVWFLGFIQVHS